MLKGIDISHHQSGIDLSKIDTDFVICKATEGVGYTDNCCDKFYQQAKKLGKKLGVYHFARPDLRNTAKAEADWFVSQTKGYHKEAILILDWESGDLSNVTWAKQWLDRVKELTGVKPLIYMSASVMRSNDWSSVVKADYGLWVASYGTNNGTAQESVFNKYPLKYWDFYALWQYTSTGKLSGYSGNLDLNYFSGDESAWDKYAGKYSSSKPKDYDVKYRAHVQDIGWQDWVGDGETAGTTGKSKRLEAFQIDCDEEIEAKAHLQTDGWIDYGKITKDTVIGSTGESKRLEDICLKGNIKFRVHLAEDGWTAWTDADGIATLGTVGQAKRIEAIEIKKK